MALSSRAFAAAQPNDATIIWNIIGNLWHESTNPSGFISLGVAENTLLHDKLAKHIHKSINIVSADFTYGSGMNGSLRLRKAMSNFITRYFEPFTPIGVKHISVTNGCSSAIEHLSWALADDGEAFLLGQPYYGTFMPDVTLRPGARIIPVAFGDDVDPLGLDAVGVYEEALLRAKSQGQRVVGVVLCHPHNPLGRCYPPATLRGLMGLCERYKIHLISDEIYALSVFSNEIDDEVDVREKIVPFTSCLSFDLSGLIDPARLHVIWGMSKDFGANGIRLGAVISQANPLLHAAIMAVSLYSSPSSLSDHVTANILEDHEWVDEYMVENRRNLARHYEIVVRWARENHIVYEPGVNAAFFLWVDLGSAYRMRCSRGDADVEGGANVDLDDVIMKALLKRRVFIASGKVFGSERPGWFRIVFSNLESVLLEGLRRIVQTLDDLTVLPAEEFAALNLTDLAVDNR